MSSILEATNNIWEVLCYADGNRRALVQTRYVRASCILTAEKIARKLSGRRTVDARPWNPATDLSVRGYVEDRRCE